MEIVFWGATGQAKVLREALGANGPRLVAVFDNSPDVAPPFGDVPLLRGEAGLVAWLAQRRGPAPACTIAIGGERGRDRILLQAMLGNHGLLPFTVIHRTAFVATDAIVGAGSQILAQAAVCTGARLGQSCIINTSASVDHECALGEGVHVAPGAHLAGCVVVGDHAMIGTGAAVLPRITIGADAVVGAGAVVISDVPAGSVVVGNPARIVKQR